MFYNTAVHTDLSERLHTDAQAPMCSESFRIKWAVDAHTFMWDFLYCLQMHDTVWEKIWPSDNYIHWETVKQLQFKTTLALIILFLSRSPERHQLHKCLYGLLTCEEGEGKGTVSRSAQQLPGGIQLWFWASESTLAETLIQRQLCVPQTTRW